MFSVIIATLIAVVLVCFPAYIVWRLRYENTIGEAVNLLERTRDRLILPQEKRVTSKEINAFLERVK